ncbi:aminotransferase class IV [Methylopila turkensis]|uniref:Probable branched-chain-amino-acid aminotransferase n=1 Tax=Methylopila turkensis TaxID=1437816 RepID=A0A9W6N5L6_9HYPH|nr:aminotransferase class IV [Methylopila turkensis]GLK78565.1 2-keto-4-methylthiobutyrate aminotransferase [Methylopila turkensis]
MLRLNGAPVDGGRAGFDLADRGLTLGDGLFETIPAFGGRPALLTRHLDRLKAAAAEIRLPVDRAFCEAEALALAAAVESDCVIRLTVTRGAGARGLAIPDGGEPTVIAAASPYPKGALNAPIRLATVAVRRNPTSFASRAKTLSYLDSVLAFDAARRAGADDALMLNVAGRVASTAMANLFAVFGRTVVTPPVSEGVLPGVIRALVLEVCAGLGLKAEERPLAADDLFRADAVFATNSVRLVMPATALDGRALGGASDAVGRLRAAVAEACGAPA